MDGLPAAGWATWVPDRSVWAPTVERGSGENGWADGLAAGALRAGPEPPTKTSVERLIQPGLVASITHALALKQAAM